MCLVRNVYLPSSGRGDRGDIVQMGLGQIVHLPQDDWLNVTVMGAKIGYTHVYTDKSEYRGEHVICTRTHTVIEIQRAGTKLSCATTRISHVDMNLTPLHFIVTSNETGQEKYVECEIRNAVAHLSTTLAGETTVHQQPLAADTVFEPLLGLLLLHRGIQVGDVSNWSVFNMDLMLPVEMKIKVLRETEFEYEGELKPVHVIDYMVDVMGGLTTTVWLGHDGRTYRMEGGVMGVEVLLTKVEMETALDDRGELDVVFSTKIMIQGKQPVHNARVLKVRLQLARGYLDELIIRNGRQNLVQDDRRGSGILEIHVPAFKASDAANLPIQTKAHEHLNEFLKSTVYIQAHQPAIQLKAVEILDGEKNAWEAAQKLCRWVHLHMCNKNLRIGFGSALQTLESLEGDCTEHTVLFIALARSAGIPARVCTGLVFQRDAFYYHFWPEVYVGDWIAMEPTFGQLQADANHIQLCGNRLESNTMLEFSEGVLRTLNQLNIEVMD